MLLVCSALHSVRAHSRMDSNDNFEEKMVPPDHDMALQLGDIQELLDKERKVIAYAVAN
jgi:hypothetical protein